MSCLLRLFSQSSVPLYMDDAVTEMFSTKALHRLRTALNISDSAEETFEGIAVDSAVTDEDDLEEYRYRASLMTPRARRHRTHGSKATATTGASSGSSGAVESKIDCSDDSNSSVVGDRPRVTIAADPTVIPSAAAVSSAGGAGTAAPDDEEGIRGACLADFEILAVIGRGGYGKVMQVRQKDSGVVYAMKSLRKRDLIARRQAQRTMVERKILSTINHPFIVSLKYAFQVSAVNTYGDASFVWEAMTEALTVRVVFRERAMNSGTRGD